MRATYFQRRPLILVSILLGIAIVGVLLLYFKEDLLTRLSSGEKITVQLSENYQILPNETTVKMAGSEVGRVQSVGEPDNGPVNVLLKVHEGVRGLLGTTPTAIVRPATLLGGKYYIELRSGGQKGTFTGDTIPVDRTMLPVELDKVLAAIPPDAQQGLQGMTERLDSTFKAGVGPELKKLLHDAPDALRPTGVVLDGLRGRNKDTDLAQLSMTANSTARVLSAKPGQLRAVVDSLAGTAKALGDNSAPLAQTISDLPDTLRKTRAGAADLSTTLDKLIDTADDARPIVRALDPTLKKLDPVLEDLRPVAENLRPLLDDARPLLDELVPTVDRGTDVLKDVQGKPLDRINGPILGELNREWKGSAPKYPNNGGDGAKLYQEIAYFLTSFNSFTQTYTATSHIISLQVATGGPRLFKGISPPVEELPNLLVSGLPGPSRQDRPTQGSSRTLLPIPNPPAQPPVLDPNGLVGKGGSR